MAVKMKTTNYNPPSKQILAFPDHYVAVGFNHAKATQSTPGNAVLEGTRYIVKAGTIYPANDSTAVGIVMNDYDVTDGEQNMAVLIHGFIKMANLPYVASANAITALKQITFLPVGSVIVPEWVSSATEALQFDAGAEEETSQEVTVKLDDGVTFNENSAETLSNWTITGEATTKVTVASAALSADRESVTFTVETTTTALVAGSVTVIPKAAAVACGKVPASAITIATVSA